MTELVLNLVVRVLGAAPSTTLTEARLISQFLSAISLSVYNVNVLLLYVSNTDSGNEYSVNSTVSFTVR